MDEQIDRVLRKEMNAFEGCILKFDCRDSC